jgi:hypothetical protein
MATVLPLNIQYNLTLLSTKNETYPLRCSWTSLMVIDSLFGLVSGAQEPQMTVCLDLDVLSLQF